MAGDKVRRKTIEVMLITVNNLKITGRMFTGPEIRLSDELNVAAKRFVILEDATITPMSDGEPRQEQILIVNKDNIVCASSGDGGNG
jgi:hypothetical protein